MSGHQTLRVELGDRGYDILIGDDLLAEAGRWIAPLVRRPKVFVAADERVAQLHFEALARGLKSAGLEWSLFTVPPGEESKDFDHLETLVDWLLGERVERGLRSHQPAQARSLRRNDRD